VEGELGGEGGVIGIEIFLGVSLWLDLRVLEQQNNEQRERER
jgi:hypothetical protein